MNANTRGMPTGGMMIAGLFHDRNRAEQAIDELKRIGFQDRQIETTESSEVQRSSGGGFLDSLGRFFTGSGGRAPDRDSLHRAILDMGISENQARYFEDRFREGDELVAVEARGRESEALDVLQRYGADTGSFSSEAVSDLPSNRTTGVAGVAPLETPQAPYDATTVRSDRDIAERRDIEGERRLELHEERLDIDKQRVQTGEVAVRKEVITETRTVEVPVTREEVVIERRPIPEGTVTDAQIREGEEIRVPVSEERVVVDKHPVATEEVIVDKRTVQEEREVSANLRREEIRVEGEGNVRRVDGAERLDDTTLPGERRPGDTSPPMDRRID